jgi:uncharacterized protein YgbK (DUF1537 family)
MNETNLDIAALTATQMPDELAIPLLEDIVQRCAQLNLKIVVLDDDPTGTQTVYNIPVITCFDEALITETLQLAERGFFILTNSRSLPEAKAITLNKEIAQRVTRAAGKTGCTVLFISRSDSTLRGHFPAELIALQQGSKQQYDGYIVMPYFKEGGRFTLNNVHYIQQEQELIPAASTAFAKDPVFHYASSNLTEYIEEKTNGRVAASSVITLSTEQLNEGLPCVEEQLNRLHNGGYAIANATCLYHAAVVASGIIRQLQQGRHFLIRSAASLVQVFFGIQSLHILPAIPSNDFSVGGLIVMGSFVPLSTRQLQHLLSNTGITPVEMDVEQLFENDADKYLDALTAGMNVLLQKGRSVVVYTSRKLIQQAGQENNLAIGKTISAALVKMVQQLQGAPKFLVAKGGITSSDIATQALNIQRAMIAGQLLPGIPVWQCGQESKFPGLPYIIFPGNVGSETSLTESYNKLVANAAA